MDIGSFSVNGAPPPNAAKAGDGFNRRWWTLKPDEAAGAVESAVKFLLGSQSARQTQLIISARHYGNASLLGAPGLAYTKSPTVQAAMRQKLSYNVIQSGIDTATAKVAKNKPKPFFLTNGGDHEEQRKAKNLNQFVEGLFYEQRAYAKMVAAFRDGAVWGDGLIAVFCEFGRVKWERVLPHELVVDELEGFFGEPRSIHRVKAVDRAVLAALYPGHAKAIANANPVSKDGAGALPSTADLIAVRESWHLRSGPDATDGKHLISIDGHALTALEKWEGDTFPFARFRWCPRLYGYWSQGAAEQIQSIQLEINELSAMVQRALRLSGGFYVLLENGSKVAKSLISNAIGTIIPYTGTKPEWVSPQIIPQEIYRQLLTLKQEAYEQLGISQLSSTSQKPAGLNSGAALREYNDIESDRFSTIGAEYERFALDLARLSIACAKEIADEQGGYEVRVPRGRFLSTMDWSKIDLREDQYVMQCFPVSSLPNDPAGRLQTIQEYIQAGMIPASMGPKLLQFPDLEQYESLQNAMEDRLEEIFSDIADEGEYSPPEPWFDPTRAREMCLQYMLRGESQGLADERLAMLQTFLSQLDALDQQAAAAAAALAPPAATGATPQAQPAQPPVSDLQPFRSQAPMQ